MVMGGFGRRIRVDMCMSRAHPRICTPFIWLWPICMPAAARVAARVVSEVTQLQARFSAEARAHGMIRVGFKRRAHVDMRMPRAQPRRLTPGTRKWSIHTPAAASVAARVISGVTQSQARFSTGARAQGMIMVGFERRAHVDMCVPRAQPPIRTPSVRSRPICIHAAVVASGQ